MHGLDGPLPGDVDRLHGAVLTRTQEHVRAVGGLCGVLDQLAAAVDPHVVIRVGLVGLQQRELRVVAEVHALVAERPAQLEDPLDTADAQPFEVQLRRDAQVQVQVVGVDVGEERPGVGAAVDLLQDRRLDLQKALADQGFADGVQHPAAGPDQVARLGVDRQVDVAGAHPRLLVGQPLPLVGQRAQALADQPPAAHHQRLRALLAVAHRAGHLDQVAQIDGVREIGGGALLEQRIIKQQLGFAGPVAQLGEQHPAVVAQAQHPPCHRDDGAVGLERLRDGVAGCLSHRVRVDPVLLQGLELGHPDPHLLGEPRLIVVFWQVGRKLTDVGCAAVVVQQPGCHQVLRRGRVVSGMRLLVSPRERQHQKAFGDHGRDADPGHQPGILVAGVAGDPLGLVFHVGPVQRLELPPPREEHQQAAPQPRDRAGAELCALLERRPEHREVQRDPRHPNGFGLHAQFADHQFDCAVGGLGRTAHQIQ